MGRRGGVGLGGSEQFSKLVTLVAAEGWATRTRIRSGGWGREGGPIKAFVWPVLPPVSIYLFIYLFAKHLLCHRACAVTEQVHPSLRKPSPHSLGLIRAKRDLLQRLSAKATSDKKRCRESWKCPGTLKVRGLRIHWSKSFGSVTFTLSNDEYQYFNSSPTEWFYWDIAKLWRPNKN